MNQPIQYPYFREHRGSFAESMETKETMPSRRHLVAYVTLKFGPGWLCVIPYMFDERNGWDTQIVTLDGVPVGFLSRPFDE